MSSPTQAEIQDQLGKVIKIYDELRLFGNFTATNNWVSMEDALLQVLETDFASDVLDAIAGSRSRLASALGDLGTALLPLLREYGKFIAAPETDAARIMDRLRQHFIDNALSVNSREFTFPSPAAGGGNIGTGAILRLNVDKDGFDLEDQWAELKTAKCIADQSTGTSRHEETFEFRGPAKRKDVLQVETASGLIQQVSALSARSSLLGNASFSYFGGLAATPSSIIDWTSNVAVVGDGSDYTMDAANYYRDFYGDTPYALNVKLSRELTQRIDLRGTTLDPKTPYLVQLAWNRAIGGATGTLTLHLGSKSVAVVIAAQAGWNLLRTALTLDAWYQNFDENALDVKIAWVRTGGELLLDDVLLVPGTKFGGGWYWVIGGATAFLKDDVFTWTDSEASTTAAKIQRALWRAGLGSLPSNKAAAETWADPV